MNQELKKQLKATLTAEEYRIVVEKGTEAPFTGKYNDHQEEGTYTCKACNEELFTSDSKFNAGCGWPSFDQAKQDTVAEKRDTSHGMIRTEILCQKCQAHLGHVFPDGPTNTGLRYCVNSASLKFKAK